MDEFDHDGLHFDVTDAGPPDGEPVILLHGFPQHRGCWDRAIPHLVDAGHRVLAPDQRGYSPRARPPRRRDYRMPRLVGDVLALADGAEVGRFHVVGHDWGGAVAWALAAWHPGRLATMTSLATPHPRAMVRSLWRSDQLLRSWYMAAFQLPALPERAIGRGDRFERALVQSGLDEADAGAYASRLRTPGAATAALNWYRAVPGTNVRAYGPSRVPTLYLYGADDIALGPRAAALTGDHVEAVYRFETLESAGHWLPERHSGTVAERVLDHIRRSRD